jgi:hypothetical protein
VTETECPRHSGYWCLSKPHDPMSKRERKRRHRATASPEFRTARMLAVILDEPHDNPDDPGDVRLEQARMLLMCWNDAKGSLMGAFSEVIRLKVGYCVRCPEYPCPDCGNDGHPLV